MYIYSRSLFNLQVCIFFVSEINIACVWSVRGYDLITELSSPALSAFLSNLHLHAFIYCLSLFSFYMYQSIYLQHHLILNKLHLLLSFIILTHVLSVTTIDI